jgi:hypothetical protein
MASLPNAVQVDHIAPQSSSPTPSIDNKLVLDEKAKAEVVVSELLEGHSRSRTQSNLFSIETARQCAAVLVKFAKFTGPGTIISVAYVDPDNFQTDVTSGVQLKFKLLFMVLLANVISIYLQVSASFTKNTFNEVTVESPIDANGIAGVIC